MHMLRKGQVKKVEKGAVREQMKFKLKSLTLLRSQFLLQEIFSPQQLFATQLILVTP